MNTRKKTRHIAGPGVFSEESNKNDLFVPVLNRAVEPNAKLFEDLSEYVVFNKTGQINITTAVTVNRHSTVGGNEPGGVFGHELLLIGHPCKEAPFGAVYAMTGVLLN